MVIFLYWARVILLLFQKDEKRNEYERKVLEAEYHFICDKIGQMKEKVSSPWSSFSHTTIFSYYQFNTKLV